MVGRPLPESRCGADPAPGPGLRRSGRRLCPVLLCALALLVLALPASAQENGNAAGPAGELTGYLTPERVSGTLTTLLFVSALSLAPALALMTTCFVRISVVLALLRQALGTQSLPSNQVLSALALFMTAAIMAPVWTELRDTALIPYQRDQLSWDEALRRGEVPLHRFMARQIDRTGNSGDVWLFLERTGVDLDSVTSYDQVPFRALAPAFLLSELKTAFLIGFQIYLPFLVIDLVVSSVIASLGTVTLSPAVVSLPFKLLVFVLVDGWHLVVGMLLDSFV